MNKLWFGTICYSRKHRFIAPDVYVCLMLQEKECTLAVLPLDSHVQQSLPI